MRRRAVLQSLTTVGSGVAVGSVAAHPLPTDDGTDNSPVGTTNDSDPLGTLGLSGAHELVTSADGHTAYVATGEGVAVVDVVAPTAPRLIDHRRDLLADSNDGPMQTVQDLALRDDRLLVVGPANPAEGAHGLVVFDASDRQQLQQVTSYETDTRIHNCDFDGRYAYLTGNGREQSPMVVVDADRGREIGTWSLLDADQRWGEVDRGIRPLHDIWVQDEYAYLAYWDAGTWILDVSDPHDISHVSRIHGRTLDDLTDVVDPGRERSEPPGNDHFVTVDDDATLLGVGSESWDIGGDGNGGPSGIELFDIRDPTAPRSLATIQPPPTSDATPGGVLTTAHNFELTDGRCYSAWYNGGVRVHDVRTPTEPREVFAWRDSASTSFWTAQRGSGCFLAANTNANRGSDVQPAVYTFPDPRLETRSTESSPTATTGASGDGFGLGATLAAVGLAAWRLGQRE